MYSDTLFEWPAIRGFGHHDVISVMGISIGRESEHTPGGIDLKDARGDGQFTFVLILVNRTNLGSLNADLRTKPALLALAFINYNSMK